MKAWWRNPDGSLDQAEIALRGLFASICVLIGFVIRGMLA